MKKSVYNIIIDSTKNKYLFKLILIIRKFILIFYNPILKYDIGNISILIKLSHMLPIYRSTFPLYDSTLPRILSYMDKKYTLNIIDIGANIGDTAALLLSTGIDIRLLCIEGSKEFNTLLCKNFNKNKNVSIINKFITDIDDKKTFFYSAKNGTAKISDSIFEENINNTNSSTLDKIINDNNTFKTKIDLIKVDTDGFDYKVLRGSKNIITKYKPMIYFELSPKDLKDNNEDLISIFKFLQKISYNDFLIYDNLGYPLGLFKYGDIEIIDHILKYITLKNSYIDILTSNSDLSELYKKEVFNITKIIEKNKYEQ